MPNFDTSKAVTEFLNESIAGIEGKYEKTKKNSGAKASACSLGVFCFWVCLWGHLYRYLFARF